jgi:hypothetical protein
MKDARLTSDPFSSILRICAKGSGDTEPLEGLEAKVIGGFSTD